MFLKFHGQIIQPKLTY